MNKKYLIAVVFILMVFIIKKDYYSKSNDIILGDKNSIMKGDVNDDGKISSLDYILIRKKILGLTTLDSSAEKRADFNSDNKISSLDYILIKKAIIQGNTKPVVEIKSYKVTFDCNGGTKPTGKLGEQTVTYGTSYTLPSDVCTKNGYVQNGWKSADGSTWTTTNTNNWTWTRTSDVVLTAEWSANKYKVSFNCDGGTKPTGKLGEQTVTYGTSYTLPSDVCTKNGYVQNGWKSADGSTWTTTNTNNWTWTRTSDVVLTAQWEKNAYIITFNSNGGSNISTQFVKEGNKVTNPTVPSRSGYVFIEWQLNGKKYDFNNKVSNDMKLDAIWFKVNQTIYDLKSEEQKAISYIIEPSGTNNISLTFESSDKTVAQVSAKGVITALGGGNSIITIKANNKEIKKIEAVVDYSFFDNCKVSKSYTKFQLTTSKNKSVDLYACIENQPWFHQGLAISNDGIYYTGATFGTWCQKNGKYTLKKYNLSGDCIPNEYGVVMYTSGNSIWKYDKKTGKFTSNYINLGGHGQAFDVTSNNELYLNYFPKSYLNNKYGYGAGHTGVAYFKTTKAHGTYLEPDLALKVNKTGDINVFTSTKAFGSVEYNQDVLTFANQNNPMRLQEHAVDEEHNQIAIMNKDDTPNGNKEIYIYKLSDFKNGKKTLIKKIYLGSVCGNGSSYCADQGIELYGNYLYTIQEVYLSSGNFEGITKIDYTTCPTSDTKSAKCNIENLNIPEKSFGTEGTKMIGLNEIEGISIYRGKVYVGVITNEYSDGKRRNNTLLVDGF